MDVSIVVQTCDKYEKFWDGFFYYMDKFWDKGISCPIYFCNETKKIKQNNFIHLPTGHGSFVQNLSFILNNVKSKYIFYLLEDFWPIQRIEKKLFEELFHYVKNNKIKALQISPFTPFYNFEETNDFIQNQKILKFNKDSDWRFNLQSRFWEKNFFLNSLMEPKISESAISSALGVEIECSKHLCKSTDIYFYHYLWYPMSGVSYRGSFTNLGNELQNNMMIDLYGKNYSSSSSQSSSSSSSSSS